MWPHVTKWLLVDMGERSCVRWWTKYKNHGLKGLFRKIDHKDLYLSTFLESYIVVEEHCFRRYSAVATARLEHTTWLIGQP